jgi:hypothetical protein
VFLLLLLSPLVAAGCRREEPVRRYTLPKERATTPGPPAAATPPGPMSVGDAHAAPAASAGPQRMLAAIVPHEGTAWFFKVVGPKAALEGQAEPFGALVRSVAFAGAEAPPTWKLPAGYTQQPGSGMRFATVQVATGQGPLDLSVTALRVAGELDEYVVLNVDRWRQQLGLAPTTREHLFPASPGPRELKEVTLAGGGKAYLVDLSGEGAPAPAVPLGGPSPLAPSAGGAGAPGAVAASPGLGYKTPEGWTPGKADGLRRAAFTMRDGDRAAELTVIALAPGSGDLLSNVNRWREQVGLPAVDAAGLASIVKDVPIAGGTGQRVELVAPAGPGPREAILGVIHARADQVWFLKLKGDAGLVGRERDRFDEFVRSVTFDGRKGGDHGE